MDTAESVPRVAATAPAAELFSPAVQRSVTCPSNAPVEPASGPCFDCDSGVNTCTPGGQHCDTYCILLVGDAGFCNPQCKCCVCPEVQIPCGWTCVCDGQPSTWPISSCPIGCSVTWYCP